MPDGPKMMLEELNAAHIRVMMKIAKLQVIVDQTANDGMTTWGNLRTLEHIDRALEDLLKQFFRA